MFTLFDFIALLEGILQHTYVEPERHVLMSMLEDLALPVTAPDYGILLDLLWAFDTPRARGDGVTKLYPWIALPTCLKRAMIDYVSASPKYCSAIPLTAILVQSYLMD